MSCSPFDLRDYLLSELAENQRRQVDLHLMSCGACHEDFERLRVTHAALMGLRDEEVPQRIGFVSDKIFEPSPIRRAWRAFWGSSARLGFASAAMLSAALVVFTLFRPAPAAPVVAHVQPPDTARIETIIAARVDAAVAKAVAETEQRQARKTAELLATADQRYRQQQQYVDRLAEDVSVLQKLSNVREMQLARADFGAAK
jgi:anti-sigma factor RsiW